MKMIYKSLFYGLITTIIIMTPLIFLMHLWEYLHVLSIFTASCYLVTTYKSYALLLKKESNNDMEKMKKLLAEIDEGLKRI